MSSTCHTVDLVSVLPNDEVRIVPSARLSVRAYGFALYKRTLEPHIAAAFGWNEEEQRARFARSYSDDGLSLIRRGDAPVGFLSVREGEGLHVSLLLVHPRWHRQGIGSAVMHLVAQRASQRSTAVTLSVFRTNGPAVALYSSLGYTVIGGDDVFLEMRLQPPPVQSRHLWCLPLCGHTRYRNSVG